jgi:hypothetical protein
MLLVTATQGLLHVCKWSLRQLPYIRTSIPYVDGNTGFVSVRMCHAKCMSTSVNLGKINKCVSVTVISSSVEQEKSQGTVSCILEPLRIRPWIYYIYSSTTALVSSDKFKVLSYSYLSRKYTHVHPVVAIMLLSVSLKFCLATE